MKKKTDHKTPLWEWLIAAIGAVLILFVLGALVWEAVFESKSPPRIELRVKQTAPQGSGELVLIEAHNHGQQVASALKVRGVLRSGDTVIESREVTIDYLPHRSSKIVGLFFSQPTAGHDLRLEPIGFVQP